MNDFSIITLSPSELEENKNRILHVTHLWETFNAEQITPEQLIKRIQLSDSFLMIGLDSEEKTVGFAIFSSILTPLEDTPRMEIWALFVDELHRQRGLGSMFIEEIMNTGRKMGLGGMHVTATNGQFYENAGFKKYIIDGRFYSKIPQ